MDLRLPAPAATTVEQLRQVADASQARTTETQKPSYVPSSQGFGDTQTAEAGRALTGSATLQRSQFERKLQADLPGFHNRWSTFKQVFFAQASELKQDDLDLFFNKFLEVLPKDKQDALLERVRKAGADSFDKLDPAAKAGVVNSFNKPGDDNPSDLAYKELDTSVQERLVKGYLGHYGDKNCLSDFPRILHRKVMESMDESLKTFTAQEAKKGFHFLGKGSFGVAFRYGIGENKICAKVSLAPEGSDLEKMFQYDEKQMGKLEANRRQGEGSAPEEYFVPVMAKGVDGKYLGMPGNVLVTELRDGESLFKFTDKMEFIGSPEFFRVGVDDQYVVDFMDFYLRNAQGEADLGDIFYNNMLYKPGHFQHIEVAGIDNESFQAQTVRRKESPEAFLLSTLMISVLTIAGYGPEAEVGMDKALRETFNYEGLSTPRFKGPLFEN